ncbi:hypothetical protein [Simkania sp.]|uniref:hypothetical protein n=1 Tax=Simkania sp. TaxID=34094 RepID=UPI003B520731
MEALLTENAWVPADFPSLEEVDKMKQSKLEKVELEEDIFYFDPVFGSLEIRRDNVNYRLFRLEPLIQDES